ncbi:MAG: acyl-CoA thioesterase [Reyranellaceae bacterium]
MTDLISTARGCVNTWQCDENDHLNVQFFPSFAWDGARHLEAALGLGPRALAAQGLAVRTVEDHIRYHRELFAADAWEVASGPVEVGESTMVAYHEIRNALNGSVAGTVRQVTRCVDERGTARAWPQAFRERAEAKRVTLPANAQPRTAGSRGPMPDLTLDRADAAGLFTICQGVVQPAECDARGFMLPRFYFARYSDGAPGFWHGAGFDRIEMRDRDQGTVVLELRNEIRRPLRAGALSMVKSGVLATTDKTMHIVHFLFDADSGELAATADGVGVLFDQKARKIALFAPEERARLAARVARLPA